MNVSSQELQKLRQELKTVREEVVWIQTFWKGKDFCLLESLTTRPNRGWNHG